MDLTFRFHSVYSIYLWLQDIVLGKENRVFTAVQCCTLGLFKYIAAGFTWSQTDAWIHTQKEMQSECERTFISSLSWLCLMVAKLE